MIRKVAVTINGKTALLMHRFPEQPVEAIEKKTPAEQARIAAYIDEQNGGNLFIPGLNIQRCFVAGATFVKGKGRATLQKQTAACVLVTPERVSLGTAEYAIDSRPVVVPATRGRILRHRPRLDSWRAEFFIEYDDSLLSPNELRSVVDNGLDRVGLLDFRPACKGPYGRSVVVHWEELQH